MRTYVLIGKAKENGGVSYNGVGLKGSVAVFAKSGRENKKSLDHHLKNEARLHRYTLEDDCVADAVIHQCI